MKTYTTDQEIFDLSVIYLSEQQFRCVSSDGKNCAYFGGNGNMCVIGNLIPDSLREGVFRNNERSVGELASDNLIDGLFGFDVSARFLSDLQGVHDEDYAMDDVPEEDYELAYRRNVGMRQALIELAKDHGLQYGTVIEEF
tara:strand:+ start:14978 stop:15400 length:423 start_codon:yes stop_codon:yes gene_type:complete